MFNRSVVFGVFLSAIAFATESAPTLPPNDPSKVPDSEKLKQSSEAVVKMRGVVKEVIDKLEEARTAKDVVKLTCVNFRLTQVKGLLRVSEKADVELQEAVATRETGTAEREYYKVMIAQSKVDQLRAEVAACLGEVAFSSEENLNVEVTTPEYLPKIDPTLVPPSTVIVDVRPAPASGT